MEIDKLLKIKNGCVIKCYNRIISLRVINLPNSISRRIRNFLIHNICAEKEVYFGRCNSDKLFYVIRCPKTEIGFMAVINYVLIHLKNAEKRDAIPIVDWQYYPNDYLTEDERIGKENAWDIFFQPTVDSYTLNEVYKSSNVIMSSGEQIEPINSLEDEKVILDYHELGVKYIRLNETTLQLCQHEMKKLNIENKNFLAVKCRGTDYASAKPKGHSKVPNVEQTIDVIKEKMVEWGKFDCIYLATEDEIILDKMKEEFGNILIYSNNLRFTDTGNKWLSNIFSKKSDKYDEMREYLISVYILIQSDSLIAPFVSSTVTATVFKGKYKNLYVFQLGNY